MTLRLHDCMTIISPDGRTDREEIALWAILGRGQLAGVDHSTIPFDLAVFF